VFFLNSPSELNKQRLPPSKSLPRVHNSRPSPDSLLLNVTNRKKLRNDSLSPGWNSNPRPPTYIAMWNMEHKFHAFLTSDKNWDMFSW
jgi:hypothetical protein